jgi:peptidoglycan/LPS O-acetylase OafA/YrhL
MKIEPFFRRIPEIDLLRALAVTGVIANHIGLLIGGFIGVDIFFVISGYVITLMFIRKKQDNEFSILDFYYQRINRVIPPLLIVSIVIFLFSFFFIITNEDWVFIQNSFLYQAFFVQNFFFADSATNYFQGLSSAKLTLHTWSLAIEEQFYLLYPLIFVLLYKIKNSRFFIFTISFVFILFIFLAKQKFWTFIPPFFNLDKSHIIHEGRYYLFSARAWELFLGCLTCSFAYYCHKKYKHELSRAPILGIKIIVSLCLLAILICFFLIIETMSWPKLIAFFPMLSTAFLIFLFHIYGNRILPTPYLNAFLINLIGRASYSLYLWHWPVLGIFLYTNSDFGFSTSDYFLYFGLIGSLTLITYVFVESKRHTITRQFTLFLLLSFIGLSLTASQLQRQVSSFPDAIQTIISTSTFASECNACIKIPSRPFVVLWGDSHAQMLAQAVEKTARSQGFELLVIKGQLDESHDALRKAKSSSLFAGLIIASRWSMYATGFPNDEPEETGNRYLTLDGKKAKNKMEASYNFRILLRRFLFDFGSASTIFFVEVPRYPFFPHKELLVDMWGLRLRSIPQKTLQTHKDEQQVTRIIINEEVSPYPSIYITDPSFLLCPSGKCIWHDGWNVYYKDDDHMSIYGAEKLQILFHDFFVRIKMNRKDLIV